MAGRKKVSLPEEEVKKIIHEYTTKNGIIGLVKYMDVYRYAKGLFEKGLISKDLSEDYWRKKGRQGRKIIDEYNEVMSQTVQTSKSEEVQIVDVKDAIMKYHKKPDELIEYLLPLERQTHSLVERKLDLEKKVEKKNYENEKLKVENKRLKEDVEKLQNKIFQLFEYGAAKDVPLENMLNTGSTRTKRVENAIAEIFNSPREFYLEFEKRVGRIEDENEKVVSFKNKRNQSFLDNYDI